MKSEYRVFIAIPIAIGLLFWNAQVAFIAILVGVLYFLNFKGLFRLLRGLISRKLTQNSDNAKLPAPDSEPTMITLVTRAPDQLLDVAEDAGTGTIFHSFYEKIKEAQSDGLRLNKQGRRLTAAKNAMLSKRRKLERIKPESAESAAAQADLKKSLSLLLKARPVYSGKVIQFINLNSAATEKYQVGAELNDLGLTAICEGVGKGSSRFVIQSQSGRLLSERGGGQVAFLPTTRFRIVERKPWQNPDYPDSPPGYSFELVEVA